MSSGSTTPPIPSILLVEDDPVLGDLLARHLTARGFVTIRHDSAEAAMAALAAGMRPSLVLLDINLPGDTGWEVLRSTAYEAAGRPPAVILTATAVAAGRLREYGVAGYLPKPFPLETLVDTVERFMGPTKEQARS